MEHMGVRVSPVRKIHSPLLLRLDSDTVIGLLVFRHVTADGLYQLTRVDRKGASGFSYYSTAEEVTQGIDSSGLTAIVTGASSGIGAETARVLALRGVRVIMAVRNTSAGKEVKEAIVNDVPAAKVAVMELDLSSLASVKKFASKFVSLGIPLNLLMFSNIAAYGQSKLANTLHANELARRLKEDGARINCKFGSSRSNCHQPLPQ
ncbi:NAD(P)-binding Rossmann-fold superfamily protein [Actinidia rufa]|uniref:NAD(P)-binding Rossmann-fold superfamily protein n=1 Tax=Actinidia rufa TaxID=165716 RepID=A0A7J0EE86_9ERIC|nr:NAD(P)-binding Rossmann-fold superfamily protein [Actinidia rufa]